MIRTLKTTEVTGEQVGFPLAAQVGRLTRQRGNKTDETVGIITSRPKEQLNTEKFLECNIAHWGIETGLHSRLDASRHDDRCRLRNEKPLKLHAIFTRIANSLCYHWIDKQQNPRGKTTTDFRSYMCEDHDRRAVSLVTSKKPTLKAVKKK